MSEGTVQVWQSHPRDEVHVMIPDSLAGEEVFVGTKSEALVFMWDLAHALLAEYQKWSK